MKKLFIKAESLIPIQESNIIESSKELPKNLSIVYSIQFQRQAEKIKAILSKTHTILDFQQVLGCTVFKPSEVSQAILLIGSGMFHGISLALASKLPIYIIENNKLRKISEKEIASLEKKKKLAYNKFLMADKIGILVSVKPGQNKLQRAIEVRNKIKDKTSYLFLADNINPEEFQNFMLESWVNTACSRLDMANSSIVNSSELNL